MKDSPRSELIELAARISDGESVDWPHIEQQLINDDPALLEGMKTLELLYQTLQKTSTDPVADLELKQWGHLELDELVGFGAFAVVYGAFDPVLKRPVALKLNTRIGSTRQTEEWIREARRLARVQHPNVLAVHGADIHHGIPGLWCDRIEGATLADLGSKGPLPFGRLLDIADALVGAVRAVHQAGLVHGDIKPANIMLESNERLILMDFGASEHIRSDQSVADKAGSPLAMAPERFAGAPLSFAVDTFGIGVVLYYLLEGRYPMSGNTAQDIQQLWQETRKPAFDQSTPSAFKQLILSLLSIDPKQRPELSAVAQQIEHIRSTPARRRRRAGIAAVMLILATALGFSLNAWKSAEQSRKQAVAVNEFLASVLATPRPTRLGPDLPITAVLDDATSRAEEAFAAQPEALADVLTSIGHSYQQLLQFEQAEPLLTRAIALHEANGNNISAGFAQAKLAELHRLQGDQEKARRLHQETLNTLTGRDPKSLRMQLLSRLGLIRILIAESNFDQAQTALTEAFGMAQSAGLVGRTSEWAQLSLEAGQLRLRLGQPLEAQPQLEASLEYYLSNWGERNSNTVAARVSLVEALVRSAQLESAAAIAHENYRVVSEWLGPRNRMRLAASDTLANILSSQGKPEQALSQNRQTLSALTEDEQILNSLALQMKTNQIGYLLDADQAAEALALANRLMPVLNESLGPEHPTTLITRLNRTDALLAVGEVEAARSLASDLRAELSHLFGEQHLFTLVAMYLEGGSLSRLNRFEAAEALLQTSYEQLTSQLGENDPLTLKAGFLFATHLRDSSQLEASRALAEALLGRSTQRLGPAHNRTVQLQQLIEGFNI